MYTYKYVPTISTDGFYWIMSGETPVGISHSDEIMLQENFSELLSKIDNLSFCGPIPIPDTKDSLVLGRGACKIRRSLPVQK